MPSQDQEPHADCAAPVSRLRSVHYLRGIRLAEGGVVRAVLDLCAALAKRGHEITLLTSDATDVPPEWKSAGEGVPRVVVIRPPSPILRLPREATKVIRSADVVHLHTPWELANLPLARVARRFGVPYVVTIHGMLDDWSVAQKARKKRLFLALAGRRFLTGAARVHCTAEAELAQAAKFLRQGSGIVIPLLVDLAPYANLPGPDLALRQFPQFGGEGPRLLFLSRLHPKKRPELLIEAATILQSMGVHAKVIVAGPGDRQYVARLQELAGRGGLGQHVFFPGMVSGDAKVSLYQASDVFVLPTSQENFGYVLIEAMACGTPVVTTKGVDIWEELQQAGAVIVEPDANQIAVAIQSLTADRERARQLGLRGREWVFRRLLPQRVIADYEQMYQGLRQSLAVPSSP